MSWSNELARPARWILWDFLILIEKESPRSDRVRQDDYSLDGKTATRNEVFNLLESCGFTKLCAQCKGFETEPKLLFLESLSGASGLHMFQLYNSGRLANPKNTDIQVLFGSAPEIDFRFGSL